MVRSNIPSAPYNAAILAGVTSTAGEINYNDVTTKGTAEASKALIVDANKDIGTLGILTLAGLSLTQVARTASADGTGTGLIADGGLLQMIAVTSAGANNIITLPTPTPGTIIIGYVGANGFELRSDTPASVGIGGGTGATAESAIAANTLFMVVCVSATSWLGWDLTGTTFAAIEAAA